MWPVQIYICWKAIARPPISLLSLNWIFNVQIRTCLTERNQLKFGETDDNADENSTSSYNFLFFSLIIKELVYICM